MRCTFGLDRRSHDRPRAFHGKEASRMDKDETTFPMDVTEEDPSSRPWNFRPEGYLVVIIADIDEGRRAETALTQV